MDARLLSLWDDVVQSIALLVLVVLALRIMVRAGKLGDVPRNLGLIVGVMILLLILPAILLGLWYAMTWGQRIGVIALVLGTVILFIVLRRPPRRARKR